MTTFDATKLHRLRCLLRGRLEARIVFLHLPKTAGISLFEAIAACYGWKALIARNAIIHLDAQASARAAAAAGMPLYDYREQLLLYFMASLRCRFISGHFPHSPAAKSLFGSTWSYITVLRDPVQMFMSHYYQVQRTYQMGFHKYHGTLEDFIETEKAQSIGSAYVHQVQRLENGQPTHSPSAVGAAIRTLEQYDLVGIVEDLEPFARAFHERFGVKLAIGHANEAPRSALPARPRLSAEQRSRIEAVSAPNIAVYSHFVGRDLRP